MIEIISHNENDKIPFNLNFDKYYIFYIYLTNNIPDKIIPYILKNPQLNE